MDRRMGVLAGGTGRASGIRPPSTYKMTQRITQSYRPSDSMPSSTSSRKANHNLLSNFGSGGSRVSGVGGRVSVFGGLRQTFASSARKSSVTAKLGPLFGTTPQHNRTSYLPQSGSSVQSSRRGSSIGGTRGHVKENRPLSEASYHRQCATKLIAFLTENGFPHPINKRLHSHPTVGDISKIFEFLFSFFDIKSKIIPLDIEIPKIMALLEYPFPVKKSDLVSFTNGRALGSLLGMLEWLIDSIQYLNNMDPVRTFYPNFDGEIDVNYELIKLCLSSADATDSSDVDELVMNQLKTLVTKTYGTEDDYGKLIDEQEKLEQELERLDDEIVQIRDLPQTIQTYQSDIKGYENYILEMEAHNKSNENLLQNLNKELDEKTAVLKKLEDQKKQLKCQVNEQEFGVEEAELARDRKQQLEEEIKQEILIIEEIKKSIRATKLECSKYEDILKKMYNDFESFINAMTDLVNSPVMSNYTPKLKELLNNDEWNTILDSLQDLKSSETNGYKINEFEKLFSAKVHELKIVIVEQLSSLQGSVTLTEQQKLNELILLVEEKEKLMKNYEIQVQTLMTEMENSRKEQVSQIAVHQNECDRSRQLLNEIESNSKRSHKEVKETIFDLRKQVEEKETQYRREQEEGLNKMKEIIDNDKIGMEGIIKKLDDMRTEEATNNSRLKSILAKTGSVVTRLRNKEKRERTESKDEKNK